jgi:hypothetical protein
VGIEASSKMNIHQVVANIFTNRLEKFNNIHEGETCYIFGDGPSIKWFDLNEFRDHPAICCGMIPFHKDFAKLNAKYYVLIEPWLFVSKILQPKILHDLRQIAAEYKKCIDILRDKEIFINLSNIFSMSGANINYVYQKLPKPRNRTDQLVNQLDCFGGSFHASLTLAYYLGFKKIYLVGFDAWTIQPARALHWYELGDGEFFNTTNFASEFLELLKSTIDIYTISKDGQSCNVKNISYETYTRKTPAYKENHELLSERSLHVLATYPKYKIFPTKI